jgi:hypothetical protein
MFFVFDAASGALYSSGSSVASRGELDARGLEAVEIPDKQVPARWRWNPATRTPDAYDPPPPPPTIEERLAAVEAAVLGVRADTQRIVSKTGA